MIRKKSKSRPTEAECNILSVIWERRSATVREVYDDLSERRQIGYTTVLKFMQIMIYDIFYLSFILTCIAKRSVISK